MCEVRDVAGAKVIVTIGPERIKPDRVDTLTTTFCGATIGAARAEPGFLRVSATATVNGIRRSEMATVGCSVQDIDASVTPPDDFLPL